MPPLSLAPHGRQFPELPGQGRDFFLKRREEPSGPVRFDAAPSLAGCSGEKQSALKTTCAQHAACSPPKSEDQRTTCSLVALELCVISRDALRGDSGGKRPGRPGFEASLSFITNPKSLATLFGSESPLFQQVRAAGFSLLI